MTMTRGRGWHRHETRVSEKKAPSPARKAEVKWFWKNNGEAKEFLRPFYALWLIYKRMRSQFFNAMVSLVIPVILENWRVITHL